MRRPPRHARSGAPEQPLRIAIVLLNRGRGSGELARQHARELMRLGHEVWLLHPGIDSGVVGATNVDIALHREVLPVHEYLPGAGSGQMAVSHMEADEAFAYVPDYEAALDNIASEVDIFIGHHANLSSVAVHRVAKRHGMPYALFLHGTGIEPRYQGGYAADVWGAISASISDATGIIVTTTYVRDELVLPLVDVEDERMLVLPAGVDIDEFSSGAIVEVKDKYGLPDRYVISPGALIPEKGPQNIVAAAPLFSELAPVVFIGDGDLRFELAEQLGHRGRFLGFVSHEDKVALIRSATILTAAPEKLEHFGIIYIEALAAGTVPVAYRGGGVGSIVSSDVGVLTERNPAALGAAVRTVLSNQERLDAMASAGRMRAKARYDAAMLSNQLADWLATIAAPV